MRRRAAPALSIGEGEQWDTRSRSLIPHSCIPKFPQRDSQRGKPTEQGFSSSSSKHKLHLLPAAIIKNKLPACCHISASLTHRQPPAASRFPPRPGSCHLECALPEGPAPPAPTSRISSLLGVVLITPFTSSILIPPVQASPSNIYNPAITTAGAIRKNPLSLKGTLRVELNCLAGGREERKQRVL